MKNVNYIKSIFPIIPHDLQGPPQSTSDSSWFFLPSSHDSGFKIEEIVIQDIQLNVQIEDAFFDSTQLSISN